MGISAKPNLSRRTGEAPRHSSSGHASSSATATATAATATATTTTTKRTTTGKPTYRKVGTNSLKKIRFHSKSCEDASEQERVFRKLDPGNPQQAHKLSQRRKAIAKGKNTIGYDVYRRKIPKEKRQKRSMVTPSTPDHTLDMPNKKWNGLVRSWRVALHRYDPADLRESFARGKEEREAKTEEGYRRMRGITAAAPLSVKEKEIADSGVANLVRVTPDGASGVLGGSSVRDSLSRQLDFDSTTTATATATTATAAGEPNGIFANANHGERTPHGGGILSELDRWEAARHQHQHEHDDDEVFFSGGEDDDSDDDLL